MTPEPKPQVKCPKCGSEKFTMFSQREGTCQTLNCDYSGPLTIEPEPEDAMTTTKETLPIFRKWLVKWLEQNGISLTQKSTLREVLETFDKAMTMEASSSSPASEWKPDDVVAHWGDQQTLFKHLEPQIQAALNGKSDSLAQLKEFVEKKMDELERYTEIRFSDGGTRDCGCVNDMALCTWHEIARDVKKALSDQPKEIK